MESMLNSKGTPEAEEAAAPGLMSLDFIEVDEVLVGDKFPVLSNARVRPTGEGEGVVSTQTGDARVVRVADRC